MRISFTQAKGGQGTTTIAAATALALANSGRTLLIGHDDAYSVLGVAQHPDGDPVEVHPTLTVCDGTWYGSYVGRADWLEQFEHIVEDGHDWLVHPDTTILVTRPCYLALSAASKLADKVEFDSVLLIEEDGRALTHTDVQAVLGKPVHRVRYDPVVARAVDAGLLSSRIPRSLAALDKIPDWETA